MAAILTWAELPNTQNVEGEYSGDVAALKDVERMVGDIVQGRQFVDRDATTNTAGTVPSRTDVLNGLLRAESAIIGWLATGSYAAVDLTQATTANPTYLASLRTLLETRAALCAIWLLAGRPTGQREVLNDARPADERVSIYVRNVQDVKAEIVAGRFALPRQSSGSFYPSVGAPTPRPPLFTFDLEV